MKPAELFVSRNPIEITTILGTCVSVCLFDPIKVIGGINHYMLPSRNGNEKASLKYGDVSIDVLIKKMVGLGANENSIVAKVFGGLEVSDSIFRIGSRNIELATQMLKARNIKIINMDVGGKKSRKIRFSSWNHEVVVEFLAAEIYGGK